MWHYSVTDSTAYICKRWEKLTTASTAEKEGEMVNDCKWNKFKAYTPGNRQKLPAEKKYVLVRLKNLTPGFPDPIVVGYLKFHAGVKSEPYFVTPGCTLQNSNLGDESVEEWCDCLPDNFEWYKIPPLNAGAVVNIAQQPQTETKASLS